MGEKGPWQIVLGGDCRQQLCRRFLHGGVQQLRFAANQIAALHVEHSVAAFASATEYAPYIGVGAQAGNDRLLFAQGTDGLNPVPKLGRLLKAQRLGLRLHVGGHVPN